MKAFYYQSETQKVEVDAIVNDDGKTADLSINGVPVVTGAAVATAETAKAGNVVLAFDEDVAEAPKKSRK